MIDVKVQYTASLGKGGFAYIRRQDLLPSTFNLKGTANGNCYLSDVSATGNGGSFYLEMKNVAFAVEEVQITRTSSTAGNGGFLYQGTS